MSTHSESTRAPARLPLWGSELAVPQFCRFAYASLTWIYLVVTTGAIVRLTGSGLGCDHWPRCGSQPFPERGGHAFIEFGNRVIAFLTILVTLATWLLAPRWRRLAFLVFLGTFLQAPLGALTVHFHLNPWFVLSHFVLSLVVLTGLAGQVSGGRSHRKGNSVGDWSGTSGTTAIRVQRVFIASRQ